MTSSNKENQYYRQLIINHYSNPVNKGLLKTKNSLVFHHDHNSCVDDFYFELTFDHDTIINARFEGIGCAISTAAIDIFATLIINQTIKQVKNINHHYQAMLQGQKYHEKSLQDLVAFKNVIKQPNRIKCALIVAEAINEIFLMQSKGIKDNKGKTNESRY
ncbi:MAG: SUF system NifU family Fe-S cluster assembly protein [Spiroplasma sp.]|nr:SUF system NifU family Fe-S cluster assembly protein [Spiroplasma sp.]